MSDNPGKKSPKSPNEAARNDDGNPAPPEENTPVEDAELTSMKDIRIRELEAKVSLIKL